ncbi:hypothetical protein PF007_g25573 [Phytophthora fragariae]|uniref:Uncharacterized protein n=1 Tax=Phytophthora fragariae TaxID=53985 RepID=A0A6A3QD99_9STRA|nr:hypothetical protein PF009_g22617 [Phytophthora fragariae]KAE9074036.1 hypothetical protein PF007_g25573 [Phytophthora fragariae]KAE9157713.1 hypothetical protein PF004_g32118 [Phytophthora fragariae]KAE9266321.1 hypothetical protein PF008_g31636 [Phytophthora fragariae]
MVPRLGTSCVTIWMRCCIVCGIGVFRSACPKANSGRGRSLICPTRLGLKESGPLRKS